MKPKMTATRMMTMGMTMKMKTRNVRTLSVRLTGFSSPSSPAAAGASSSDPVTAFLAALLNLWPKLSAASTRRLMTDRPPTTPIIVPASASAHSATITSTSLPSSVSGSTSVRGVGRPQSMEMM